MADGRVIDSWQSSVGLMEIRARTTDDRTRFDWEGYFGQREPLLPMGAGKFVLHLSDRHRFGGRPTPMGAYRTAAAARKAGGELYRVIRTQSDPSSRSRVPAGIWGEGPGEKPWRARYNAMQAKEQAKIDKRLATCTLTWEERGEPGSVYYSASAQGVPYAAGRWMGTSYLIGWIDGYKRPSGYSVTYVYPPSAGQIQGARTHGVDLPEREQGVSEDGSDQKYPDDRLIPTLAKAKRAAELHCRRVSGRAGTKRKKGAKPKPAGQRWRWKSYRQGGVATSYSPTTMAGIAGHYDVYRTTGGRVDSSGPHQWAVSMGLFSDNTHRRLADGYTSPADAKAAAQIHQETGNIPSAAAFTSATKPRAKSKAPGSSGKFATRKKSKMASSDTYLQRIYDVLYVPGAEDEPWDERTLSGVDSVLMDVDFQKLGTRGSDKFLRDFQSEWYRESDSQWDAPEYSAPILHDWKKAKAKAKPKAKAKSRSKAKPKAAPKGPSLCCLEWSPSDPATFLWRSRGGTGAHSKTAARGTSRTGSRFYKIDLAVLIERMGKMGLTAARIAVETRPLKDLALSKRTIARDLRMPGAPVPANELRAELGSKSAKVGRPPGAKGGGNTTRSLRFYLSRPLTAAEARKLDRAPTKAELDTAGKKPVKPKSKLKWTKLTKRAAAESPYNGRDTWKLATQPLVFIVKQKSVRGVYLINVGDGQGGTRESLVQAKVRAEDLYRIHRESLAKQAARQAKKKPAKTQGDKLMDTIEAALERSRPKSDVSRIIAAANGNGSVTFHSEPNSIQAEKDAKAFAMQIAKDGLDTQIKSLGLGVPKVRVELTKSSAKRKPNKAELDVLDSMVAAIEDSGDPEAGRQYFKDDAEWDAAQSIIKSQLGIVSDQGPGWVFVQISDRGIGAQENPKVASVMGSKTTKTTKKKSTRAKAKKTETKVEKATYLSFEESDEFNKAVVRLLGTMDAPKTTTIDASSLQIRIPMAKTTAGVQKLVKGLRSGKDRAKFRVHNPHPPREYNAGGKGTGKLGDKIKRYRTKRNMSRAELAKVMLIEPSTLGQIERGSIQCPPYARLDRAADKLKVKTSTLTSAAACDYRTKKARKTSKKKKKANRATPVAKNRCARKGSISSKTRDTLPAKAFGLPETRAYPMFKMGGDGKLVPSASHASNAKARAKQALNRGNLTRKDYDRIIRKANKVLGQCSAPVRRAKKKAKKSARAKARRLCPSDQRKILNRAVKALM